MGTKRSGADDRTSDDTSGARTPGFDTVRRGYRPEQVDAAVRELQWRLEMAERGQREAQERVTSLTASLEAASASAPDTFGMRAEKILRMAEHDAGRRRDLADDDAERILAEAHAEAEQLRAEARAGAERASAEARAEAERRLADATAAVAGVHAEAAAARRDTDRCADAAASMHEHVLGLRSAVRGEVARLHAAMGAELRALDDMPPVPQVSATVVLPEQRPQPIHESAQDRVDADAATEPASA